MLEPISRLARHTAMHRGLAVAVLAVLVSACAQPAQAPAAPALLRSDVQRDRAPAVDALKAGEAINAFALDAYRALPADGNLVFSPASISLALAMARCGAAGRTATQMDAVMHEVASDDNASWLNALDGELANRSGTFEDATETEHEIALRIANSAFVQRGMPLKDTFLDALATRFGAGVQAVDYARATQAAREAINSWVADRTEGRIEELIPDGMLDPTTRLTLVNAVYLKAPWMVPFDEEATEPGAFTRPNGSAVQVPMMRSEQKHRYAEGSGWQAIELPYAGNELSMVIVVPEDLEAFETTLDASLLSAITEGLEERLVTLSMPRFGFESNLDLTQTLAGMGMPSAFGPDADFSGITDAERLFISAVLHQANIEVDELGTEAAAATAVIMPTSGALGATLEVDRPFLFLLRDVATGTILFLGRVTDPSEGA